MKRVKKEDFSLTAFIEDIKNGTDLTSDRSHIHQALEVIFNYGCSLK